MVESACAVWTGSQIQVVVEVERKSLNHFLLKRFPYSLKHCNFNFFFHLINLLGIILSVPHSVYIYSGGFFSVVFFKRAIQVKYTMLRDTIAAMPYLVSPGVVLILIVQTPPSCTPVWPVRDCTDALHRLAD